MDQKVEILVRRYLFFSIIFTASRSLIQILLVPLKKSASKKKKKMQTIYVVADCLTLLRYLGGIWSLQNPLG